jgi:hypothetical protein
MLALVIIGFAAAPLLFPKAGTEQVQEAVQVIDEALPTTTTPATTP